MLGLRVAATCLAPQSVSFLDWFDRVGAPQSVGLLDWFHRVGALSPAVFPLIPGRTRSAILCQYMPETTYQVEVGDKRSGPVVAELQRCHVILISFR